MERDRVPVLVPAREAAWVRAMGLELAPEVAEELVGDRIEWAAE